MKEKVPAWVQSVRLWAAVGLLVFHRPVGEIARALGADTATQAPGAAARAIYGSYSFTGESSGTKPVPGAEIVLKFEHPNVVTLRAVKPKETLTDIGTFDATADQMSITLPELGKSAAKAKYRLNGNELTLPLLILADGNGTSTWTRINRMQDPLSEAVSRYYANVNQQGKAACLENMRRELQNEASVSKVSVSSDGVLLVTYRSGYREFFLAPSKPAATPRRGKTPGQAAIPLREQWRPNAGLEAILCSAPLKAQFLPGGRGARGLDPKARFELWLAREPEPISRGDAPKTKTALVLSAFHTLPVLIPGGEGLKYDTFAQSGENLNELGGYLKQAGYAVEGPHVDAAVSVGKLFDLFRKRSWGVFYFNTHGGILDEKTQEVLLSTGEQVPVRGRASPEAREKYIEQSLSGCKEALRKTLSKEAAEATYQRLRNSVLVGFVYDDVPFVAITSEFFGVAEVDFSQALVFINGCDSAKSARLREALHCRSFMGWDGEVNMELAADVNGPFWRCLSLKTRSDREAMDFAVNYLLEAKQFGEKLKMYGPTWDPHKLVVYRQGKKQPEKLFASAQHSMLNTVREYALRRRASRIPENLAELANQLSKCNEQPKGTGLGADPFCRDALIGAQVEGTLIDEVKGELCGFGGQQARFTLIEK